MRFIKVTFFLDDSIHLINTDWITEISPDGSGSIIYMAFTATGDTAQNYFHVKESPDRLCEMLTDNADKPKSNSDEIAKALCTLADFCKQQKRCGECPFGFICSLRSTIPSSYDNLVWLIKEGEE